jgi:hypothetical protein
MGHVRSRSPVLNAHVLFGQAVADCSQLALEIMHGRTMNTGLRGRKFGVARVQWNG